MRSLAALLALMLACDDPAPISPDASMDAGIDSGTDAGSDIDEEGCRILTLGERDFQFNLFSQLTGLRYPIEPNLEGAAADHLLIELYDSTTGGLPPLAIGTFELDAPPNDDLATCQHCFWLRVDETESGTVAAVYYQSEGAVTLDRVSDPLEPSFAGSTGRVVLRRATVTDDGHSTFVAGGDCVS